MDVTEREDATKNAPMWWGVVRRPEVVLAGFVISLLLVVCFSGVGGWSALTFSSQTIEPLRGKADVVAKDRLLGGLLSSEFDEHSCLSRYRAVLYRKTSHHLLSPYLVSKLRKYEALHKKCGPGTPLYKKSLEQLKHNHSTELECNYVFWSPIAGLGNRMLTVTSIFLYALLTNRVLLIDQPNDMVDVFCEPFPGTSWVLPDDFPIKNMWSFHHRTGESYGVMLEKGLIKNDPNVPKESLPSYVYAHLPHDYNTMSHRLFFCDEDQLVLRKVNWLLIRSDNYFAPGLFMIQQYEDELRRMFPIKETVFHHLGRYLFHPSNTVWGLITRYYDSYLAKADERVGVQIRTFFWTRLSSDDLFEEIIRCAQNEKLLPPVNGTDSQPSDTEKQRISKATLVVSLHYNYYEKMKSMYYEHSTTTGEIVSVYQPTHEGNQQTEKQSHNQKALAEIWLLSFCDELITTSVSTFGYVSNGLAGLKPLYLAMSAEIDKVPDPPCRRAVSMEPCFHSPPNFDCRTKKDADTGMLVPHVRHCADVNDGVKLVD
uniref:Fucosyltransferase n=1 Tax=Ananas comosus var. bracteatus TaxID=296719 RepID=A0A6V7P8F7_ANACO|nr:unnamed protein product [Ananas comosus var. bracteatus]